MTNFAIGIVLLVYAALVLLRIALVPMQASPLAWASSVFFLASLIVAALRLGV